LREPSRPPASQPEELRARISIRDMSENGSGIPSEALALLDEHVQSFEQLEALLLLHQAPLREWTADEVADALGIPADLTAVLEHLAQAQLIAVRSDELTPVFFYGPATSALADAVECLASTYERSRTAIMLRMNSNVIDRLRDGAARVFAESFVVAPVARTRPPATDHERRPIGLFLDVDGTLLEFASRPELVAVPTRLVNLLMRLYELLGGALALVSGRSVRQLDALFAPLQLPCAGIHGGERRDTHGRMHELSPQFASRLGAVRAELTRRAAAHTGLLVEDKGASLAVHYREQPQLAAIVEQWLRQAQARLGHAFRIQEGICVRELVPAIATKGGAVEAFLAEPAFAGKMPVFIGDDVTDLDAFSAVTRHGGRAIAVGVRVDAATRLPRPSAVIDWLEFLVRAQGRYA
jgi:trehalose 6-phosphate phosphatase